jgi:hypothetical protein
VAWRSHCFTVAKWSARPLLCAPLIHSGLIFVVDSADRDRLGKTAQEFQAIIQDPLMIHRWAGGCLEG